MQNDIARSWKKQVHVQLEAINFSPANSSIESKNLFQLGVSKYLSGCCLLPASARPTARI